MQSRRPLGRRVPARRDCDAAGQYSLYSDAVADENYLRGVQESDSDGRVSFTSIFPGCYAGRWPHVHFEVYPSLARATGAQNKMRTSQLAKVTGSNESGYTARLTVPV